MRHLAAFLLCVMGGNATPSASDITKVIESAGGTVDEETLTAMMGELEGKSSAEVLAAGMAKLDTCIVVGSAAPAAGDKDAAAAPTATLPKEEEVDALEGGMSMFGDSGGDY